MEQLLNSLWHWAVNPRALAVMRAFLLLAAGLFTARFVSTALIKVLKKYIDAQQAMLVRRIGFYVVLCIFLVSGLRELGFKLHVLLGAAGIFSVAIGFASQTSVSNLISGLFLIAERPFAVGDVIKTGDVLGEVLSIDLLSVKLRTFDNLYVRLPNESMIKSQVTTMTRFPIRRVDLQIGFAYKENIGRVREVLMGVADRNPLSLEEPKPLFIFQGFGDSSLNCQFSVWTKRENFLDIRNSIQEEIKEAFDAEGIEIPFPHRTLYTGSVTEPFPVRVVKEEVHDEKAVDGPDNGDDNGMAGSA